MRSSRVTLGVFEPDDFEPFTWFVTRGTKCVYNCAGLAHRYRPVKTASFRPHSVIHSDFSDIPINKETAKDEGFYTLYQYLFHEEKYKHRYIEDTVEGRNLLNYVKDVIFDEEAPPMPTSVEYSDDLPMRREFFECSLIRYGILWYSVADVSMRNFGDFLCIAEEFEPYAEWEEGESFNHIWDDVGVGTRWEVVQDSNNKSLREYILQEKPTGEHFVYVLQFRGVDSGERWWYVGYSKQPEERISEHINSTGRAEYQSSTFSKPETLEFERIHSIRGYVDYGDARDRERSRAYEIAIEQDSTNILGGQ